jgi:hypothetical protein
MNNEPELLSKQEMCHACDCADGCDEKGHCDWRDNPDEEMQLLCEAQRAKDIAHYEAIIPARITEARAKLIEEIEARLFYIGDDGIALKLTGYKSGLWWQKFKRGE